MSNEKMSTWPYAQWYRRSDISQMGALDIKLGGWNLHGSAFLALWLLCGCEVRALCNNINSWPTQRLFSTQGPGELGLRMKRMCPPVLDLAMPPASWDVETINAGVRQT